MGSLLTDPIDPALAAKEEARQQMLARVDVLVVDCLLRGYEDGDWTFEEMCRQALPIVSKLSDAGRWSRLGFIVEQALRKPAPKRRSKRGLPYVMRDAIRGVVDLTAEHEGLGKAKSGELWARVAARFSELGVVLSPRQVERIYYVD